MSNVLLWALTVAIAAATAQAKRPHIVYILVDDLGFNDVSFHGSGQIPTPHVDKLAEEGLKLSRFYVAPVCSPTRSSLNSGRSIIHTGIYTPFPAGSVSSLNTTCNQYNPDGTPTKHCPLLPEVLRDLGYSTHAVGKWHLGLSDWDVTPLGRGFESYHGYLNGAEEYFFHRTSGISDGGNDPDWWGWDFWNNTNPADPARYNGSYSTTVFTDWAVDTIHAHAASGDDKPLYLYLAYQAVHEPLMAPQAAIDRFNDTIADPRRRTFAAMASEMDRGVGRVRAALEANGMAKDTLIVLTTDNGGPACDADGGQYDSNCASNMPLRGRKFTITEGGVRGVGLVWGAGLAPSLAGTSTDRLVHVTDWYFTLASAAAAGIDGSEAASPATAGVMRSLLADQPPFSDGDSRDQWAWLSSGDDSKHNRTWAVHTIAPDLDAHGRPQGAIMNGTWKLVTGGFMWLGGRSAWYHTPGLNFTGPRAPRFTVQCGAPPADDNCRPEQSPCLFDLATDPCEHTSVAGRHPEVVASMRAELDRLAKGRKPDLAAGPKLPLRCAPSQSGGVWHVCAGTPPAADDD